MLFMSLCEQLKCSYTSNKNLLRLIPLMGVKPDHRDCHARSDDTELHMCIKKNALFSLIYLTAPSGGHNITDKNTSLSC